MSDYEAKPIWYVFNQSDMCSPDPPEHVYLKTLDMNYMIHYVPERTATIVKVPHKDYISIGHYECGLCGASITPVMRYCHGCGAKLEGASE
jgi:hypothetical protein